MNPSTNELAKIFAAFCEKQKLITGAVIGIRYSNLDWTDSYGSFKASTPYFIASTTKLYTSAIVFKLADSGRLTLNNPISEYLPSEVTAGIHSYRGKDYSNDITVRHLLEQSSGLPDYFQDKPEKDRDGSGAPLMEGLLDGRDKGWTALDIVALSKTMEPKFPPGKAAHYSDTNFQLLGMIIEKLTQTTYASAVDKYVCRPLGLKNTYVFEADSALPHPLNNKNGILSIPQAMVSFGPDGGIVSDVTEQMIFLQSFYNGELFSKKFVHKDQAWRRIFFPFRYGTGHMEFKLPRIFSPFKPFPRLIGHLGLSGAFAFYQPDKDIYLTGTVNQLHKPDLSFKLMLKLLSHF